MLQKATQIVKPHTKSDFDRNQKPKVSFHLQVFNGIFFISLSLSVQSFAYLQQKQATELEGKWGKELTQLPSQAFLIPLAFNASCYKIWMAWRGEDAT